MVSVVRVFFLGAIFNNSYNDSYDLAWEICGCSMIDQKCKIKCPNCGFTRDCSDP